MAACLIVFVFVSSPKCRILCQYFSELWLATAINDSTARTCYSTDQKIMCRTRRGVSVSSLTCFEGFRQRVAKQKGMKWQEVVFYLVRFRGARCIVCDDSPRVVLLTLVPHCIRATVINASFLNPKKPPKSPCPVPIILEGERSTLPFRLTFSLIA